MNPQSCWGKGQVLCQLSFFKNTSKIKKKKKRSRRINPLRSYIYELIKAREKEAVNMHRFGNPGGFGDNGT